MPLVPGSRSIDAAPHSFRFDDRPLLWTVDDVLSPIECAALVERMEASGRLTLTNPMYRNQDHMSEDDGALAALLLERLRPHVPEAMGGLVLHGLSTRLRMYRYRPGQNFPAHTDHWYQSSPTEITLHTVLVYLNDAFEGGQTRFSRQVERTVAPRTGTAALWQHKLDHEGLEVTAGVKYALRTDVVYRSPDDEVIVVEGGTPERPRPAVGVRTA